MLDEMDEPKRLAIARAVVAGVIGSLPNVPEEVSLALRNGSAIDAAAIADSLDGRYFELDEAGDPGALDVFCQARAAMAACFLLEESPHEALYEAAIAIDNPDELLRLVREAANGAV
jgi:hypothetical protein